MITDRVGRKGMLIIGMAMFGLASLVSSYAQTPAELIWGGDAASWLEPGVIGPIAAGIAVLTVFCVHESRTEYPSLDVQLFQ